jgi:GNAT superfamily N-acetyltransferase
MALHFTTLAEAPEREAQLWDEDLRGQWPRFMLHAPSSDYFFAEGVLERYRDWILLCWDDARPERLAARAFSVPVALAGEDRPRLPDGGWDTIVRWAHADLMAGRPTDAASALEVLVRSEYQGHGLSTRMLTHMRANAARLGARRLVAPVRPTGKAAEPRTAMAEYAARRRDDGLAADPWLRTHERLGARIVRVAPTSFVVPGSLAQWREWTGLPFDHSGEVEVPGALVPVHCSIEHDHAVYTEPNVWMEHPLP